MTLEEYKALPEIDRDILVDKALGYIPNSDHIGTPNYSADMRRAWLIIETIKTWRPSKRLAFFGALKDQLTTEDGKYLLRWPDALTHLKPEHLCIAALRASEVIK